MIRVTKTEEPSKTLVTIDGRLSGEAVGLVQVCCKEAQADGKPVHLFLRDVTAIDDGGRLLLQRLAGNGVRVSGSGVYTSYVVEELTTAANGRSAPVDSDDGINKLSGRFRDNPGPALFHMINQKQPQAKRSECSKWVRSRVRKSFSLNTCTRKLGSFRQTLLKTLRPGQRRHCAACFPSPKLQIGFVPHEPQCQLQEARPNTDPLLSCDCANRSLDGIMKP